MNEFTFIVTTSGYVESSQLSNIVWLVTNRGKYDLTDPVSTFQSLADDLFQNYLDFYQELNSPAANKKCHRFKGPYKEHITCEICGERLRKTHEEPRDFENFANYICRLSSQTAEGFGDDLDRWAPGGVSYLLNVNKDNIILVSESFDALAAKVATSPYLTDEEQVLLKEYQAELYPAKAKYNESIRLMEIETDFDL